MLALEWLGLTAQVKGPTPPLALKSTVPLASTAGVSGLMESAALTCSVTAVKIATAG